jgi:hypothetical protein
MSVRVVPSERGNRVAISPAKAGSGGDRRGQKRGTDQEKPADDADTSDQALTAPANGHVDKLA